MAMGAGLGVTGLGRRVLDPLLRRCPPELRLRVGMARRHREPRYLVGSQLSAERSILERSFQEHFGYRPDLLSPRTFNEKLQWRKLFDHRDLLPRLIDKVRVRSYVESRVGAEHLIPLLYVADSIPGVPFAALQPPYIVKPTHASGVKIPVRPGEQPDEREMERVVGGSLGVTYGVLQGEWAYWKVEPRIVVERLLLDDSGRIPPDFKIHCFGGEAHFIQVDADRFTRHRRTTYDRSWVRLDLAQAGLPVGTDVPRPDQLPEMIRLAELLSEGLDYVRVDLYDVEGTIYFGEMTLYPSSGFRPFSPQEWDHRWGALWTLPDPTRSA